jgi:hypothetical protein
MFVKRKHTSRETQRNITIVTFALVTLLLMIGFSVDFHQSYQTQLQQSNTSTILNARREALPARKPIDIEAHQALQAARASQRVERRLSIRNNVCFFFIIIIIYLFYCC